MSVGVGIRIVGVRQSDGLVLVGVLSPDGTEVSIVTDLDTFWASPHGFVAASPTGATQQVEHVELVPPVVKSARVLCVGLNYSDHVKEGSYRDEPLPEIPTLFARWPASLSIDGAGIPVPSTEDGLDWEGEVVAWIGAPLVDATPEEALAAVVGYSTFNDVTSRRAQKETSQWTMGKNGDRSGPIGPMVPAAVVGDLRDGLQIETRVNGEVVQHGSTAQMIYGVGETLAHISRSFTINPGDLLATGTPSGVGYARTPPWLLHPGDVVEVEVERLGVLTNHIVDNTHRHQALFAAPNESEKV
ncbi:fumarylacetoacetate hydrolase family protein [Paenarthrobacter sp. PH39-S1]|uniref:fumarylacetoacetate hydrolase family protein n=1 Tax=Paenarthrobacter sp. PH39-S1 TaxID=3046204 RepID=UPI0024BB01A5|nr:fumarylacetoacetate hydrolase family protein [Paenarthrobacter sp. PH39-S1]MDJ0358294.1 fumarylacetoacetate hydrolase family protein [Paenarthrobacter sp. PH39-S1]